jgi:hypothetical protein
MSRVPVLGGAQRQQGHACARQKASSVCGGGGRCDGSPRGHDWPAAGVDVSGDSEQVSVVVRADRVINAREVARISCPVGGDVDHLQGGAAP